MLITISYYNFNQDEGYFLKMCCHQYNFFSCKTEKLDFLSPNVKFVQDQHTGEEENDNNNSSNNMKQKHGF